MTTAQRRADRQPPIKTPSRWTKPNLWYAITVTVLAFGLLVGVLFLGNVSIERGGRLALQDRRIAALQRQVDDLTTSLNCRSQRGVDYDVATGEATDALTSAQRAIALGLLAISADDPGALAAQQDALAAAAHQLEAAGQKLPGAIDARAHTNDACPTPATTPTVAPAPSTTGGNP